MKRNIAVFSAGCFWGVEYLFRKLQGVLSVTSGYTGGNKPNPTYEEVCSGNTGHYEAVLIEYQSDKITYEHLVRYFFEIHDFTQTDGQGPDKGQQYLSNIFYIDNEQYQIALEHIRILTKKGYQVATGLLKFEKFWPAEDYHQNYYEKNAKKPYCHFHRPINWQSDKKDYPLWADMNTGFDNFVTFI